MNRLDHQEVAQLSLSEDILLATPWSKSTPPGVGCPHPSLSPLCSWVRTQPTLTGPLGGEALRPC